MPPVKKNKKKKKKKEKEKKRKKKRKADRESCRFWSKTNNAPVAISLDSTVGSCYVLDMLFLLHSSK
jgi:hypothetical protein